ncbi:MAG TPA: hypothetical protein VK196_08875 [Magnetospirillum sp.]|nr:hypothetical protein [Magnetospirillum sp.]
MNFSIRAIAVAAILAASVAFEPSAWAQTQSTWNTLYMAQSQTVARRLEATLKAQGIPCKLRLIGKSADGRDNVYEVLVASQDFNNASAVLVENGF